MKIEVLIKKSHLFLFAALLVGFLGVFYSIFAFSYGGANPPIVGHSLDEIEGVLGVWESRNTVTGSWSALQTIPKPICSAGKSPYIKYGDLVMAAGNGFDSNNRPGTFCRQKDANNWECFSGDCDSASNPITGTINSEGISSYWPNACNSFQQGLGVYETYCIN